MATVQVPAEARLVIAVKKCSGSDKAEHPVGDERPKRPNRDQDKGHCTHSVVFMALVADDGQIFSQVVGFLCRCTADRLARPGLKDLSAHRRHECERHNKGKRTRGQHPTLGYLLKSPERERIGTV
eukprot:7380735-Prymnesium_polylepis.2